MVLNNLWTQQQQKRLQVQITQQKQLHPMQLKQAETSSQMLPVRRQNRLPPKHLLVFGMVPVMISQTMQALTV